MHHEEQFLKSAAKPQMATDLCGGNACRELTIKEILNRRADDLRKEAFRLESLANQYREGQMDAEAEDTLRRLLYSSSLYR